MPPQTLDGKKTTQAGGEQRWDVRPGSASSPRAKFSYRLCAPLRWWQRSTCRIVAQEIGALPRRILAVLHMPHLRFGHSLLSCSGSRGTGSFVAESEFVRACRIGMQQLQASHRWAGVLDLEIAAQAYRAGSDWATHNLVLCKETGNAASVYSCDQFSQVPDSGANASSHSGCNSQARMDAAEIIVSEMQSASGLEISQPLRESVRQPSEPPHLHSDR